MKPFSNPFFGNLANEPWAHEVWAFLNEERNVLRMEAVSLLGHPALEAVVLELEQAFGDRLGKEGDRNRQLVGAMIKQVLEPRGWEVAAQGQKMALGHQFSVATRYHQPGRSALRGTVAQRGGSFLDAMAQRYGLDTPSRHYLLLPCAGMTIGVDELKSGLRRVHAFSDKKLRHGELASLAAALKDFHPQRAAPELAFRDALGARNHDRRYVGWEWMPFGTIQEEVDLACDCVEALRSAWLGRA